MAGLYDLLIKNAAAQSRVAPPAPSIGDTTTPPPPMAPEEVDLATSGEVALGVKAGYEQTKGMVKGALAAAADAVNQPKFGQSMRQDANANMDEAQRISSFSSAPQQLKDVGGVGEFLDYARFGVPKQVPQFGAMALGAPAGAAGVMGVASAMNIGAQYLEGNSEVDELSSKKLVSPEREAQLREQVLVKSGLSGVLMGALDTLGFAAVAPRLVGAVARALPRQVIKAMSVEGSTEAVQEYIGMTATKLALERPDAYGLTQDELWRLADAGVLGGLTGGSLAVPGAAFSRAGQGLDAAVDLAGAGRDRAQELYKRFRPSDDNAAAAGVGPIDEGPSGPSGGARLGMALRGMIDTDPEVIKTAVADVGDQLMQNEYVARAVQEGGDLIGELRKSTRLNKIGAFEQQVRAGFDQFIASYEAGAETDNIEAMYGRYKEMISRVGPDFSGVNPARAGAAAGAAVAGFNDWLGRTDAAAASIFNSVEDVVGSASEVVGRYAKAGAEMTKDAWAAAAAAMRRDVEPTDGSEQSAVNNIAQLMPPGQPGVKKNVVAGRDVKIIEQSLRQLGAQDGDAVRFIARRLAPMLSDRAVFDSFMSSQPTIDAFKEDLGLYPHQVAAYIYTNLRANGLDSEAESLGYLGLPGAEATAAELTGAAPADEAGPQLAEDAVDVNETGVSTVEQTTLADAKAEEPGRVGALQNKALEPGQAARAAFERAQKGTFRGAKGSQRWIIKTETVKDPATGAVLETRSEPTKINMIDVALAESGARQAKEGQTLQQRKDEDFMQGVGAMFNGWQETDDKGRTVEVTIQPGRDQKGTVVPSEDMDGWIRPREQVGTGGRTFNNLEKDNRANTPVRSMATAIDGYLAALEGAQENSVQDKSAYDAALINAAVNAVRNSRFPQDLSETADLKAYEAEIGQMIEWVDSSPPNVAVDGMWALLRDAAMPQEVKDVLLSQLNAAVAQDDPTQTHTEVEESAANLKLMRRQIIATAPEERGSPTFVQGAQNYARGVLRLVSDSLPTDGVIPAALLLLPSDIVKKQELASKLFGAMKNAETIRTEDNDIFADPMAKIPDQEVYDRMTKRDGPQRVDRGVVGGSPKVIRRKLAADPGMGAADRTNFVDTAVTEDYNHVYVDREGPMRDVDTGKRVKPINTISGKAGLRALDPLDEKGRVKPLTQDESGRYIDYGADIKAGKAQGDEAMRRRAARKAKGVDETIPIVRKREGPASSVVTAVREKAQAAEAVGGPVDQGEVDLGGTLASQNASDFFFDDQIAEMNAPAESAVDAVVDSIAAGSEVTHERLKGLGLTLDQIYKLMERLGLEDVEGDPGLAAVALDEARFNAVDSGETTPAEIRRELMLALRGSKLYQQTEEGRRQPELPLAKSVVTARRNAAAPEVAAQRPKGQAEPSGSVEFAQTLSRADIRANPDKVYVFGDNLVARGLGGQAAAARGEPNAIGIPTKRLPTMGDDAFFGKDVAAEKQAITAAVDKIVAAKQAGKTIVVPAAGVGTGLAQLQTKAPAVWTHLQTELDRAGLKRAAIGKAIGAEPTIDSTYSFSAVPDAELDARLESMINEVETAATAIEALGYTSVADRLLVIRDAVHNLAFDRQASLGDILSLVSALDDFPSIDSNAVLAPLVPLSDAQIAELNDKLQDLVGEHIKTGIKPLLTGGTSMSGAVGVNTTANFEEYIGIATLFTGLDASANDSSAYESAYQTVHHEVMHSVVTRIIHEFGIDAARPLIDAAQQPHIRDEVLRLTKNDLQRRYFSDSPEEMLAQAYALWATGKLELKTTPRLKGFFNQVAELVRKILAMLSGDQLLAEVFASVKRGDAAGRHPLNERHWLKTVEARKKAGFLDYDKFFMGQQRAGLKRSLYEGQGGLDLTTDEGKEEARRRIREIAGDVGIHFGAENTYDPEGHVITLAVSASADLGTAYHESVHAIFKAIEANDKGTLYTGLNTMQVRKQLKELLRDSPDALKAALSDPEELAAYAFQFYKRGQLRLGPETQTWFDKLLALIEKAKNWVLDQPGAQEVMQRIADGYYASGGPSPLELAALRDSKGAARRILTDSARGLLSTYDKLLSSVDDQLRNTGISELSEIAQRMYTQVGEKTEKRGMVQEIPIMTNLWMNRLAKAIGGDAAGAQRTLEAMALGDETSEHAKEFRHFLNQMRTYMQQAGADVGFVKGYLPMQWSGDKIAADEAGFKAMLSKYEAQLAELELSPERVWDMMSQRNVSSAIPTGDVFDGTGKPTMWHTQERVFGFLSAEDRRPYVEDNLIGTMGQYVKQAVKRAEWERHFPNGEFDKLVAQAKERGATDDQIAEAKDIKEAAFGAKYNRMSPTWRRALGAMQTYQNVRVLGLALFSSVADPLALGVRSGDFKEAWGAFKYGFRHLYKEPKDALATLAEDIGTINELGNLDALMTLYGGFEVEGNIRTVNDMVFKYNGLEGLTRGLRVYAVGAGVRFLARADTRALAELGLKQGDLKHMPDGTLAVRGSQFKELGMTNKEATDAGLKMQRALNRFVDESVLRPNAAERPRWANDPIFALLFHLKQFIFSFYKIVGKKVAHEFEEGSKDPAMYLSAAAFVPLMAATGYVRDVIQYAGAIPADRDFMHYLTTGINRSGFIGPSVLPMEVSSDLMSGQNPIGGVGGPAASQALEALQALANPGQFGGFVKEAMPLSSVYKRWI